MESKDERRESTRHKTFWTVIRSDPSTNKEIGLGFLLNISETGMNIWINKEHQFEQTDFSIKLYPPEDLDVEPINLIVHQVWTKFHENSSLVEMGCEFVDLAHFLREQINQLITDNQHQILKGAIMI